jgi:uncharacterized protein (TIGR03086 family)
MIDEASALRAALGMADRVIAPLGPRDLDRPTPCAPWSVRDVIDHLAGGLRLTAAAVAGRDTTETRWRNVVRELDDPIDAFHDAAQALATAIEALPTLDGTCVMPEGRVPVGYALDDAALEAAVHAWDVAVAVGRRVELDPAVAERLVLAAECRRHLAGNRGFSPQRKVGWHASAFERLLAVAGRSHVLETGSR